VRRAAAAALLVAAAGLAGCGPKPAFRAPGEPEPAGPIGAIAGPERPPAGPAPPGAPADSSTLSRIHVLEDLAAAWVGTPYRRGGEDARGVDCSALARSVLGELGVDLPRTTRAQQRVGDPVPPDDVAAGDLLFFRLGSSRVNHVGIALGAERFLHASSTRGVVIEWLGDRYFAHRLVEVRRVFGS
jgi:probable lipoprotein NlpC